MIYQLNPISRLWLSGLLHAAVLAVIFYLNQTPNRMFVGQQVLSFDLVQPPPPPPPTVTPRPPLPSPPAAPQIVEPPPRRRKLDDLLDRLDRVERDYNRQRSGKESLQELRERLKELEPPPIEVDTTRLARGIPRPATTTVGPTGQTKLEVGAFPFRWYLNILQQRVYNGWKQPSGLLVVQDFLKAVVHLRIDRDGSVSNISLRQSSGHSDMDRSALEAVQSLGQMPSLPDAFARNRLEINIHFEVTR